METLPPELLHLITSHLSALTPSLSPYATISPSFRATIERLTFQSLKISTPELPYLTSLFSGKKNAHRREYLGSLTVQVLTAPLKDENEGCCVVERLPGVEEERAVLSESLIQLFSFLKDLEDSNDTTEGSPTQPPLNLNLWLTTPANGPFEHLLSYDPILDNKNRCRGPHSASSMMNFLHERMRQDLLSPSLSLPELHRVKELVVRDHGMLGSVVAVTKRVVEKLVGLERLDVPSREKYQYGRVSRRGFRDEFADVITSTTNPNIQEIEIAVANADPPGHEYAAVPVLIDEHNTANDAYTRVLRHFSSPTALPHLTTLHITGKTVISPDIFHHLNKDDIDREAPMFPSLRSFHLETTLPTATGTWFYNPTPKTLESTASPDDPILDDRDGWALYGDGPVCERRVEWCHVRSVPDEGTFLPFLRDAAASAARMPRLQRFRLRMEMEEMMDEDESERWFEFCMVKAGTRFDGDGEWGMRIVGDETLVHGPRLYWRVTDWVPGEEVLGPWKEVAGPDTMVVVLSNDEYDWDVEEHPHVEIYKGPLEPL